MYVTGKHRYDNYTSRYDVYLFTLRDYVEVLLDKFNGRIINRSDMPIHTGYLMEFVDVASAKQFIAAQATATDTTTKEGCTLYTLPHLEGNTLPVYATVCDDVNYVYLGLSTYADALDQYINGEVTQEFTISFDANGGTGTMNDNSVNEGATYTVPASSFTAPESKVFSKWNTKDDGSGTDYDPDDTFTVTANVTLYAQWIDA